MRARADRPERGGPPCDGRSTPTCYRRRVHAVTRPFLLFALAIAVLSGACNATAEALPKLDDPTEILEEALRTTAELEYVHARVDVAADIMGSSQSYAVDADLDMGRREFHAVVELAGNGAIAQRVELLLVGTDMFTRMQGGGFGVENDGRWQRTALGQGGDPRAGIPPTPAIAVALGELFEDEGLTATLVGSKACGDRQCYEVQATIAPELTWKVVNGGLFGGQPGAEPGPPDPSIPQVVVTILVDEATRRLMSMHTKIDVQGQAVELTATLSNHDVELRIVPPPPDQVSDPIEGILEEVGGEVMEPVPGPS